MGKTVLPAKAGTKTRTSGRAKGRSKAEGKKITSAKRPGKTQATPSAKRAVATGSTRARAAGKSTIKAMMETAEPLAPFMCFRTPIDDVFIKCDWNPVERRYNRNCRRVGRAECQGSA